MIKHGRRNMIELDFCFTKALLAVIRQGSIGFKNKFVADVITLVNFECFIFITELKKEDIVGSFIQKKHE